MDEQTSKILSALLTFFGQLVWPVTMVIIFSRFKPQIIQLLGRIGSIKVAGSEWVFQAPTVNPPEPSRALKIATLGVAASGFLTPESVQSVVSESNLLENDEQVSSELLIFETPKQKTWLVSTNKNVFILLDDEQTRQGARYIQTYFPSEKTLPLQFSVSDGSGVLKFRAQRNWWYYSTQLFPTSSSLTDAIRALVEKRPPSFPREATLDPS